MSFLDTLGSKLLANNYDVIPIAEGCKFPKGLADWKNVKADPQKIKEWSERGFTGIGVLAKNTPAIDIDVHDPEIVRKLTLFCQKEFGLAPIRVGKAPKTLLVYKTDSPFTKLSSPTYEDALDTKHKLEILGEGQQFVSFHVHPETGKPYKWVDDIDITKIKKEDLPSLSRARAEKLLDYFSTIIPDDWIQVRSSKVEAKSEDFDSFENFKNPADISTEKVIKAINYLDPDCSYDQWVKIGMALYHQYKGSELGFEIWDEWSSQGDSYQNGETKNKWKTFKENLNTTNPITFASVIRWAREVYDSRKKEKHTSLELIHASKLIDKLGSINWLVKNFIESDTTGILFGDPGSYKSFLAMDIALHCVTGREWHGNAIKQGSVVYLAGEGHGGLARRLAAWTKKYDENLEDHPFYFSQHAVDIYDKESAIETSKAIEATLDGDTPKLIVIDTLAKNFGSGDENSTSDMNVFIAHVDQLLRAKFNCVVLLVHHTGHKNKERARGAMALKGAVDFEYRIEKPNNLIAQMTCTKMKDAIEPQSVFFQGESIQLGIDEDEEISSLVFNLSDAPIQKEEPLKGKQKLIFDLIPEKGIQIEALKDRSLDTEICNLENFRKLFYKLKKNNSVVENDGFVEKVDFF